MLGTVQSFCQSVDIDTSAIPSHILALPVIRNGRLRRTVAQAVFTGIRREPVRLEMSARLLRGSIASRREVIAHEVAHLTAGYAADHGPEWRAAARSMGCTGERFATKALIEDIGSALKTVAICDGCGHELKRARRLNKNRNYRHGSCGRWIAC